MLTPEMIKQYHEEGWLVVPGLLNDIMRTITRI
jgi:hypothetical protein